MQVILETDEAMSALTQKLKADLGRTLRTAERSPSQRHGWVRLEAV